MLIACYVGKVDCWAALDLVVLNEGKVFVGVLGDVQWVGGLGTRINGFW